MRIVLISDTHLAPVATGFTANARAAADWIRADAPDLVVHLGDVTADGIHDPAHFDHARQVLADLGAPLLAVPGNHDIGENPPGAGVKEPGFMPERLAQFRAAFGEDRWVRRADGWTLIGLNAQLFSSGDQKEDAQAAWLGEEVARSGGPIALFLHKPLYLEDPDDPTDHTRFVPPAARRWLRAIFSDRDLQLVVSGHVHQARDAVHDGIRHLWTPSTAFLIPDALQPRLGDKRVGLIDLTLDAAGIDVRLTTPPGMAPHDILDHAEVYPQVAALRSRLS